VTAVAVPEPALALLVADIFGLCRHCGDAPRKGMRALCRRCYDRAWHYGRLDDYPPLADPWVPSHEVMTARHLGRVEDFGFLLTEGVPFREACRRIGVTTRTGLRYKAILRERATESAAAVPRKDFPASEKRTTKPPRRNPVNDDTTGTGPGPGEVLDARLIARLAAPSDSPERDRLSAALAEVASLRDQLAGQSSQRNRLVGDYNELDDRHATLLEEILRNADEDINGGDEAPEYLAEAYVRFLERERDEAAASYRALEARNAETCAVLAEARDFISRLERIKTAWTRGMYCAWIDCQRGDTKAAIRVLSEGLDGYDGTEWDGTETGGQWRERTKAEEGL
jgi:hypothetical protein